VGHPPIKKRIMRQLETGPNSLMAADIKIATTSIAVAMKAASAAQLAVGYSPNSLESIESSLNTLRVVLVIFTWMVGFGLILEYKTPLHLICKGLLRIARGKSNSFDRCALRKMCWHFLGALLVTVGVLGEFWVEFKQYGAEKEFSRVSESERDSLKARTAQAEATAKGFDLKISESDAKAKSAEATAKGFEAQIANAQRDAAASKREAESERLARVELQRELAPRRLTGVQKEKLTALLSADPQQIMFGWCMTGADDCKDFVNDIGDAFNRAGWKTWFAASTQNKRGIRVGFMKGSDEKLAAHWVPKIRNALAKVGLSSEETWFDPNDRTLVGGFEKNVLYLIVGQKPAIKTTTANDNSQ
jgi:hypothetical protein